MLPAITFNVERWQAMTAEQRAELKRHLHQLPLVLDRATELDLPSQEPSPADDIVITCAICADAQWWIDNFGPLADAAHWLYCGVFGLDCPNSGG
jgi:hypothetical protein